MSSPVKERKIRKAVFPVAGMGTRFLPATKAMPKELLPIIDKPIIQYAVEEAIEAGITELIFVTGRTKRAIEDHFDHSPELEMLLESHGKHTLAEQVREIIPPNIHCIFVRQPEALGLGHAILCAEPVIGDAPFAVLLPDDLMAGSAKPTSDLVKHFETTGRPSISVLSVPDEAVGKYGIIKPCGENSDQLIPFSAIVEKPETELAPSNFASVGRYIFTTEIFDHLRAISPGVGNEYQLTDAINAQAQNKSMDAVPIRCHRYDCGSKLGYIEAILDHALWHEEFGPPVRVLLQDRITTLSSEGGRLKDS